MKEESPKDIFDTRCWLYQVNTDPYQVFAEAFSTAGMEFLRRFIKKILHYAEANEIYYQKSPCDVLLFMRVIRSPTIRRMFKYKTHCCPCVLTPDNKKPYLFGAGSLLMAFANATASLNKLPQFRWLADAIMLLISGNFITACPSLYCLNTTCLLIARNVLSGTIN